MGATLSGVNNILKDIYMGASRPVYRLERYWTCPAHKKPHYARWEEVCDYDPRCHDYDCPHTSDVMVDPGCASCADSEWELVLDDNGEPIVHYEFRYSLQDQLSEQTFFLKELMKEGGC